MGVAGPQKKLDHRRLREVIKEFLSNYQYLYEKRIQKLVFYGEIYCLVNFERRLTDAEFVPYMYGSFSKDISNAINELEENEEISTETVLVRGSEVERYLGDVEGGDLDNRVSAIIRRVHHQTKNQSTDDLAKFSKQNWLFENTEYGEPMNFRELLERLDDEDVFSDFKDVDEGPKVKRQKADQFKPALIEV